MTLKTVTLSQPIVRGGEDIVAIDLRRPSAGELRGTKLLDLVQMDTGAVLTVLPRICAPAVTEIEAAALDPFDLFQISTVMSEFFTDPPEAAAVRTSTPLTSSTSEQTSPSSLDGDPAISGSSTSSKRSSGGIEPPKS